MAWTKWAAASDPLNPPPERWGRGRRGLGRHNVYAGQYPLDAFDDLDDFAAFCAFTSSAQQALFRHGPGRPDKVLDWFSPTSKPPQTLFASRCADPMDDAGFLVLALVLPRRLEWLRDQEWLEAAAWRNGDELEIVGRTRDGFVTVFTVDG